MACACGEPLKRVCVRAEHADAEVHFSISDDGVGIAEEHHARIFRAFERLRSADVPGDGLGLAICRKLVEANGGRLWLDSAPGKGATFHFTLPAPD